MLAHNLFKTYTVQIYKNNNRQIVLCVLREVWTEYFGTVMKGDINSDLGVQTGFLEVVKVKLDLEAGTCQQAKC